MMDLIRLSPRRIFPPGGQELYRQVARLTGLTAGTDVLDVACGKGIPLEFFVREHGVHGTGVESDSRLIADAEKQFKALGLSAEVSFQEASSVDLPFRNETFDVVVGELGLAADVDPGAAVRELVRVARPGGWVVVIQLVWKAPIEQDRKRVLAEHLGARPMMGVELRRVLLEAGVGDLHIEDWTDEGTAFRSNVRKPFPDFAELFGLIEKLGIVRRAWGRWGWRGVRTVFQREAEVHRLLTRQRILGLNLVVGVKAAIPSDSESMGEGRGGVSGAEPSPEESEDSAHAKHQAHEGQEAHEDHQEEDLETSGLPLFSRGDADS